MRLDFVRPASVALVASLAVTGVALAGGGGENIAVVSTSPAGRALDASVATPISVTFDRAVDASTIDADSFRVFGRWSGAMSGSFAFSNGGQTVSLLPSGPLTHGEMVMVILSNDIDGADGTSLRSGGYSFQFWTAAMPSDLDFTQIASMTTRTVPQQSSRAYGGIGTDLDNDGWMDITIVNEDTADLRVFLNQADGTGLYHEFIEPPFPVNDRASPSEPADFDNDGNADICVANIDTNSVSILLGNGDGTFAPHQEINVGLQPRGIAVLDADGDGDPDVVNTNSGSSGSMSLLTNDGNGVFSGPIFFDGNTVNEYALGAADMNEDGLLDLVIGARNPERIIIQLGNGDGTFSFASSQDAGGGVWMLACGDVNGDGHEDVATANSSPANNGAILLGDGTGNLAPPVTEVTDPFPLATDLGDVDGDGDLDWATSSFSGDWYLFVNDGDGNFSFQEEFNAPSAASCALMIDIDNDRDLDLALIDELADVVILMQQGGAAILGDLDGDGDVDAADLAVLLGNWGTCKSACAADLNGDGEVNAADLAQLLGNWT